MLTPPARISVLAGAAVLLPLTALAFCLVSALIWNFDKATFTHCEVAQFLPSISSVIGGFPPTQPVWNAAIALQSTPRFLFARMYLKFYQVRSNKRKPMSSQV